MNRLADRFAQMFRAEHRAIRDALLHLMQAFQARDKKRIRSLLERTAELTGPHFRHAEEALYPALLEIFGAGHIDNLLADHDRVILATRRLAKLAAKPLLTSRDAAEATRLVRGILPHVSDCDGLSLMVERLPADKVRAILEAREHAHRVGLDLLQWAELIRKRRP